MAGTRTHRRLVPARSAVGHVAGVRSSRIRRHRFPLLGLTIGSAIARLPHSGCSAACTVWSASAPVVLNTRSLVARLLGPVASAASWAGPNRVDAGHQPVGIARQTRANGNGVDLMRNAPVDMGR